MPNTLSVHSSEQEWTELATMLSALYRMTAAQYDLAAEQKNLATDQYNLTVNWFNRPNTSSTRTQALEVLEELKKLRELTEQAGKPKEKSFSFPKLRLPQLRLSPAWFLLVPISVALLAIWFSWDTLSNAIRILFP